MFAFGSGPCMVLSLPSSGQGWTSTGYDLSKQTIQEKVRCSVQTTINNHTLTLQVPWTKQVGRKTWGFHLGPEFSKQVPSDPASKEPYPKKVENCESLWRTWSWKLRIPHFGINYTYQAACVYETHSHPGTVSIFCDTLQGGSQVDSPTCLRMALVTSAYISLVTFAFLLITYLSTFNTSYPHENDRKRVFLKIDGLEDLNGSFFGEIRAIFWWPESSMPTSPS